jgi:serine phosphatase RsbU (regulator of sigma subunit)
MFNQNNYNVGIEYSVKYIPSDFLSGDLYDVWKISENKVSVLIADVCGHGVSSALIATFMKATLKELVNDKSTTGEIFSKLNNRLVDILPLDMYVSAFIVIIDIDEKTIEYSSAGHPAQLYYNTETKKINETKGMGDTLLSIIPNVSYKTYQRSFNQGDRLLLFTDGIYELRKDNGEIFGRKKFYNLVEKYISLPKDEILNKIIKNAYEITERNFLEDDVNIILIDL